MLQTAQNIKRTSFYANNRRLIIVFVLLLLSSAGVFGQTENKTIENLASQEVVINSDVSVAADVDMDFMNWFMGSNQNQNMSSDTLENKMNTKKQFLSNGVTPNRVLYKTLLKKVASMDRALV